MDKAKITLVMALAFASLTQSPLCMEGHSQSGLKQKLQMKDTISKGLIVRLSKKLRRRLC